MRLRWARLLAVVAAVLVAATSCSGGSGTEGRKPVEPGVRWASGANGNDLDMIKEWETFTGRAADVAVVFTERSDWSNIVDSDWPFSDFPRDSFTGDLSVAQPLFPSNGNLAACAGGAYDGYWAQFGRTLNRNGRSSSYVRLGWEFNGDWFWWAAYNPAEWKTCFRRSVTAIRSTDPAVRIEWNLSAHRDKLPAGGQDVWSVYPGDRYVDVISLDAYDSYPASETSAIFNRQCRARSGLCTVIDFARGHGKKFAVPEWGLVREAGGGGDNPLFIKKMHDLFATNRDILAYEAYYNTAESGNVKSALHGPVLNPRGSTEYLDLFGVR